MSTAYVGCFTESTPKVFPYLVAYSLTVPECAQYVQNLNKGYRYFGASAWGSNRFECRYGSNSLDYIRQYGAAACGGTSGAYNVGIAGINAVYDLQALIEGA